MGRGTSGGISNAPMLHVTDMRDALKPGAPQIHAEAPGNLCYDWEFGDKAATERAFAGAAHVTKLELVNNRLSPNPMEPRSAIGEYEPGPDMTTVYTTSQNPHVLQPILCAFVRSEEHTSEL